MRDVGSNLECHFPGRRTALARVHDNQPLSKLKCSNALFEALRRPVFDEPQRLVTTPTESQNQRRAEDRC